MQERIKKALKSFKNFSGVIKVWQGKKVIYEGTYGYSNKEKEEENNLDTRFLTCSITKLFTALSIMKLQEEGKMDINDPVIKYIEGINIDYLIKIKDLLCHKSGIKDFLMERNTIDLYSDLSPIDIAKFIFEKEKAFSAGEGTLYSNTGYLLLALVIENVSGDSYEDYIKNNFFKPLHMDNSDFLSNKENYMAQGYFKNKKVALFSSSAFYGCGNIISTADDLMKFIIAIKTYKIVSKETLDLMTEVHSYNSVIRYGYGFMLNDRFGDKSFGHSGSYPNGYSTIINHYEGSAITILVLCNDIKPVKLFIPGVANASFIEGTIIEAIKGEKLNKISKCI